MTPAPYSSLPCSTISADTVDMRFEGLCAVMKVVVFEKL